MGLALHAFAAVLGFVFFSSPPFFFFYSVTPQNGAEKIAMVAEGGGGQEEPEVRAASRPCLLGAPPLRSRRDWCCWRRQRTTDESRPGRSCKKGPV